eukprot:s155_g39.t1
MSNRLTYALRQDVLADEKKLPKETLGCLFTRALVKSKLWKDILHQEQHEDEHQNPEDVVQTTDTVLESLGLPQEDTTKMHYLDLRMRLEDKEREEGGENIHKYGPDTGAWKGSAAETDEGLRSHAGCAHGDPAGCQRSIEQSETTGQVHAPGELGQEAGSKSSLQICIQSLNEEQVDQVDLYLVEHLDDTLSQVDISELVTPFVETTIPVEVQKQVRFALDMTRQDSSAQQLYDQLRRKKNSIPRRQDTTDWTDATHATDISLAFFNSNQDLNLKDLVPADSSNGLGHVHRCAVVLLTSEPCAMARKSKVLSKSKAPKKDFTKVKNKVGKKKQEKANEMKTDFKVKKVQMPAQNALEEKGEEVTHRKLGLGELLAHLQHHSSKVRRDALKGLLELCRDHPGVLNVNLSQILDSISLAASDGSADVRSALRSLQAPPDPAKVELPVVPQAKNVGKDGFPELPSLEDIMTPASQTMSGISSRAKELETKMLKMEKENSARLEKQKKIFDRKLKEQEEKNQLVGKENAKLAKSIMRLKKKNEEVFSASQQLKKAIGVRRTEMKSIQEGRPWKIAQLIEASKFLTETLDSTDESQASELKVLDQEEKQEAKDAKEAKEKQKVDSFVTLAEQRAGADAVDAEDGAPLSFLELHEEADEEPKEAEPESLLNVLAEGVKDMKQQGEASSKHLKSLFMSSLQDGMKRHKALLSQQQVLKQTLESMQSYQEKLAKAEGHLKETKAKLDKSLHDSGIFLQKLSQLTLSKPEESAFILDQMPSAALSAFGATLALQVRGAISHVSGEVREDGLKLLELYLSRLGSKQVLTQGEAGRLVSTLCQLHSHSELVLPCLLQLLSTQTSTDEEMGDTQVSQLSLQDVLEGKLNKVTSVSTDSEADNEIWDFCLRAWMQAGDMPRGDAKGSGAKAGWMRLRVAAVLEQALIEVLAGSGDSRPSASQVATLSGIVRRQEWPIHVDAGSALRPLADSINLRMARMLALLVTGGASQDAAPKHLQRLAHASLAVLDSVLVSSVASVAAHVRQTLGAAAAAAAAAQALEVVAKGSDEASEVKPFTSVGALCHGLLVLDLLWSCVAETELWEWIELGTGSHFMGHFSSADVQHLASVTAAVAAGTGQSDDEFLPTTAAILAVPLTASLLDLHCDPVPPLLQRAVPRTVRKTSRNTAQIIEEVRPGEGVAERRRGIL